MSKTRYITKCQYDLGKKINTRKNEPFLKMKKNSKKKETKKRAERKEEKKTIFPSK